MTLLYERAENIINCRLIPVYILTPNRIYGFSVVLIVPVYQQRTGCWAPISQSGLLRIEIEKNAAKERKKEINFHIV